MLTRVKCQELYLAKVYANFRLQLYICFSSYEVEYSVTEPCISHCIMCNDTMLIQCFWTFFAVYVKLLCLFHSFKIMIAWSCVLIRSMIQYSLIGKHYLKEFLAIVRTDKSTSQSSTPLLYIIRDGVCNIIPRTSDCSRPMCVCTESAPVPGMSPCSDKTFKTILH
jgi:hypothetical protein